MALPVRPYRPQRCIHQKLHPNDPNPTKMFEHLQYLQCEPRRTTSAVEVQHGSSPQTISPAALHPSEASPQSTHMFKHLPCSSIFNAMAFPLRPYHPRRFIHQKLHANQTKMFEHLQYLQCEARRATSAVEVQHGSFPQAISPAALHPSEASPQSTHMFKHLPCSSIFNAMAFPLRPYHPRRFIHQKLHANQTKMFEHLQYLQCEARRTTSAVEVQHGSSPQAISPAALHPSEASPQSTHMFKHLPCSSIFNAMAFPLRPHHTRRFIHQKLHANQTKMFEHLQYLQCEARRATSAVEVQHGSFPQAISPAALHPSEASPQSTHMFKHLPCSSIFNAMAFPLRPYHPQRFIHQKLHPNRHTCSSIFHVQASSMRWLFPSGHITHAASSIRSCTQIRRKWSSIFNIFNAKPTGPYRPLRFSMVHLIPKPFVPRPTVCPPGWRTRGNRSVTKLPPGTWPGKEPCVVSRFPTQSN